LIVFLAFAVAFGFVLQMSVRDADLPRLLNGVDGNGQLCGVNHTDYPYLYYAIEVTSVLPGLQAEVDQEDARMDA